MTREQQALLDASKALRRVVENSRRTAPQLGLLSDIIIDAMDATYLYEALSIMEEGLKEDS